MQFFYCAEQKKISSENQVEICTTKLRAIEVFEILGFMLFMMRPAVKTTLAFKYD